MVEPRSVVYHLGAGTLPPSPQKLYLNFRNNRAMLYKNLPAGRLWTVLAVRWLLDALAAAIYLARGERANFNAVCRALRDFGAMRRGMLAPDAPENPSAPSLKDRRRAVQTTRRTAPRGILRGSIVVAYMLGVRRFSRLRIR
jgi:hypothetical protein